MARFRRRGRMRRSMRGIGRSYRRGNRSSLGVMDVLLAGAIYGVARPTIANAIPTFFSFGPVDSDNVILGAADYMLSRSNTKLLKAIGLIGMGTEAGIIMSNVIGGSKSNGTNMMDV